MQKMTYEQLSEEIKRDVDLAEETAKRVFPRDRDVAIGAVVTADDGRRFAGANIVKERFTLSTCAERMAVDRALFEGLNKIERIVVIGKNDQSPFVEPAAPCGNCRQMIFDILDDLGQEDIQLVMANSDKSKITVSSVTELLPLAYKSCRNNE